MDIYQTINAVMADIGVIEKCKKNQQQNWKYRGIDDVMNALQPSMIKHGLFIVPNVLEHLREERQTSRGGNLIYSILKVQYTFYAQDGSSVSCVVIGEGMDSGDKSSNKALAIAMKYACFQVFCIPTEETHKADANLIDPDSTTPEESTPKHKKEMLSEADIERLRLAAKEAGAHGKDDFFLVAGVQWKDAVYSSKDELEYLLEQLKDVANELQKSTNS